MLASDAISQFETYVDDTTELSSAQELTLLQKVFGDVWSDRPWEFAKVNATGTFSLTTPNIPIPADFSHFVENDSATDNTSQTHNNAAPKVIFIGANLRPYQIINWSDRRQYQNRTGFAYLDLPNSAITLTGSPTAPDLYDFDYKLIPPTLVLDQEIPKIPEEFQPILWHLMAIDDEIILHFPRASSYAPDNKAKADGYMDRIALWNANLRNE